MSTATTLQPMARSFRQAPHAARRLRPVDLGASVRLSIVLKPRAPINPERYAAGRELDRTEFDRRHGARAEAIERVVAYARQHGLAVESADAARHTVKLRGTYQQAITAFQPQELGVYSDGTHEFVARSGHLHLPADLAADVVAVQGFDERPIARPHFRAAARAVGAGYDPAQVAAAYRFPTGVTGAGQTIALLELGGGYAEADVAAYFSAQGVNRTGTLTAVPVDGAANAPGGQADGEVQLDIEVAGCVAPGANIVVYFVPNTSAGFLDGVQAAVADTAHAPSVLSISWGGPESIWSAQDLDALDQAFQSAGAQGLTVCVASGDNGAVDNAPDGHKTVDFPASSPNVLGCGGTSLPRGGAEVAWNDGNGAASGGGFSAHFAQPTYQLGIQGSGRGVPDVAGNADPATGYNVSVDGSAGVIGGTSAVAPLWAGLIALVNQSLGRRVGFVNPVLYAHASALTDITSGNNDGYDAGPGWDPVTGLGSPIGQSVLAALRSAAPPATS